MLPSMADQEAYVDMAAKAIGVSPKAIEEMISQCVDLYQKMSKEFGSEAGIRKADPLRLAESIFRWFNNGSGARFFKAQDKMCLFYQRKIYEIDNNLDFNTLMQRLTKLAAVEKPGSTVWYFLRNLCNLHGEPVDLMSWLYTDRERDTVYLNLNSAHNKIIRVAPNENPTAIDNGTNENAVLLSSSPQIRSFELLQTQSEAEGFAALKRLLMDTTPCEMPQKYFLICWMISLFLMDLQGDRGLMHIIGSSGLGKSKVAERVSYLIYGESYVGKGTGAAETRVATSNPILFMDNLENRNLTLGVLDLLLFIANSQHKPKAKSGSDTEVLYQKLKTMCLSDGIEPFPGRHPELISRTFPLILDARFKMHGYMHDETVRQILKSRNLMLSSILRMIGHDVLPRLAERSDWSKKLQTDYPGHNKERNNEHICTMLLILEGVLKYLPSQKGDVPVKKQASDLLDHWITTYEEQAQQTAVTSNTLLVLMDGLAREILIKMRGKTKAELDYQAHNEFGEKPVKIFDDPEYLETFFLTEPFEGLSEDEDEFTGQYQYLEFIVTAADLFTIFNRYCANQHIRNPFETPTALGARISNDRAIMESGGWDYISRKEGQSQYKKIMGKWYWRFQKKLRAML
jgi:DNA primase